MKRMWSRNELKKNTLENLKVSDVEVKSLDASGEITGSNIVEKMEGYSFVKQTASTHEYKYAGVVKTGNKITFVIFLSYTPTENKDSGAYINIGNFTIPSSVGAKLYPQTIGNVQALSAFRITLIKSYINTSSQGVLSVSKTSDTSLQFGFYPVETITANTTNTIRVEATFLLSDNLAPEDPGE